jgi:SAM-dependent methyltransferase
MFNFLRSFDYYPPVVPDIDLRLRININKSKKLRVLNVGAGSGYSALAMQLLFFPFKSLTFLDIHEPYLETAKSRDYQAKAVNFVKGDIRNFNTEEYDLVLMFDILEHLQKNESFEVMRDIKCSQIVFIPLEKKFRPNVFGAKSQDHLSLWTEDNFKMRGYSTEVLPGFHEEMGEVFDALWAVKLIN